MNAWYNEIDPFAAQWIENLAAAGHVAAGAVERRSIVDLRADDVPSDRQVHLFAGIGGWSRALRLAGWPDDLPVWTGSCPCQPFSVAGKGGGINDDRHLWPEWFRLIREHQPPVIFGEQVASPAGLAWLDVVSADLERAGYAVGAADLCAASVGAPHIRQRLYFVARALGESAGERRKRRQGATQGGEHDRPLTGRPQGDDGSVGTRQVGAVGNAWDAADWLRCRDGKFRPVEPGTFPLAHGLSGRVGRLRGYGNAIVPELAATFIRAVMAYDEAA